MNAINEYKEMFVDIEICLNFRLKFLVEFFCRLYMDMSSDFLAYQSLAIRFMDVT